MASFGRSPLAYRGLAARLSETSPADKVAAAKAIAAKLEEGANLIVSAGKDLSVSLDRTYAQYENSATQNRLAGALRAAYNVLKASDPFMTYIMGNVDNQALVKLQGAERTGLQWMNSIKDQWFGEGPNGVNLHEALMLVNDELAQEVEATFNGVQQSTASISTLSRQVEQLPEEIISRGLGYYFSGLKSAGDELWFDISSIFKFIKAALDAVGVASNDMTNFLNTVFPKSTTPGGKPGPASAFPSAGTLILVGVGIFALYVVLK